MVPSILPRILLGEFFDRYPLPIANVVYGWPLNSFIAVKSGYPFAIDDGIKISLPEIITYKHVRAYIGSSIIQLQDGWVTFGGTTEIFSTKTGGEVQEKQEKSKLLYCHWTHISRFLAA